MTSCKFFLNLDQEANSIRTKQILGFVLVLLPIVVAGFVTQPMIASLEAFSEPARTVTLQNGDSIELAPDEILYTYNIASGPTDKSGISDVLLGSEYGVRTDTFIGETMYYDSDTGTIETANLSVPLGEDWEGYRVDADVTSITENRTWIENSGFSLENANWAYEVSSEEGAFSGNNRIQYFSSTGSYQGQWGSRGTATSQFIDPWGVAFDSSDNLYVVDSVNNRVQVFSSSGTFLRQWGSYGGDDGEFDNPSGIAIGTTGLVYVVDSGNDRVQVFNTAGVYQFEWGTSGTGTSQFHNPVGIAIRNSNGHVYVTDMGNDRVQYFDNTGTYVGSFGDSGTATSEFRMPTGIAINQNNDQVIIADSSNNRVKRHSSTGTYLSYVGSYTANGGGSNGYFRTPIGVAVSSSGTIFVTDIGNHRVQYFSSTGSYQGRWGTDGTGNGNFRFNYGIGVSSAGVVYTSERSGTGHIDANWLEIGHGTGNPSAIFQIDGYWHNTGSLYGFWYNPSDKAYVQQDLSIDRGDVTWAGISLDYYGDCRGWNSYMTGFFELFVSLGDPDNDGEYLWDIQFDAILDDNNWYSTGLIEIDPSVFALPDISVLAGLRVTQSEWYRSADIRPEGRLDNILLYIRAKASPEDINLKMNGVNVIATSLFGLGTAEYTPSFPWNGGSAYANFSWIPSPNPPDPNFDINVDIDVEVSVYARRYGAGTIYDTESFASGEHYYAQNATEVVWDTNYYVAVPGGYSSKYFFNVTIPSNRDIDFVGQPTQRTVNLSYGWLLGDTGDGVVNISVYDITLSGQNGFWYLRGNSPNMISALQVWDNQVSQWVNTKTFRANEGTRFLATLPSAYAGDLVNFTVYDPTSSVWISMQATVNGTGHAVTNYVNLDAYNASVGLWEVQAYVSDAISSGSLHNIGFYTRQFSIDHSTGISVKYPVGSETTWTKNATYGDLILLQFRVFDSDNTDLLPGGLMTYLWAGGPQGIVSNLGTGEYSVTLDTGNLPSNGQYNVSLQWTKSNYDPLSRIFTLNVLYTTELLSPDAPGVDTPRGYNAELEIYFEDQASQPITEADIACNWTHDTYLVAPVVGSPGHYALTFETDAVEIGTYAVEITANKDFYEPRSIILSVQVRELFTSAIPSTSQLSLPVGYTTSFTITYTDTDHNMPISSAESSIKCNWSDIHSFGDQNYTIAEISPGVYEVTIFSADMDVLRSYQVNFSVESYGAQNHTFVITVVLRTHLTSFYLINPIDPTPYTGDVFIYVSYFDVDAGVGIENGSLVGYNVLMTVQSSLVPSLDHSVANGTNPGEYIIVIPANQWGSIGSKDLTINIYWNGPTVKYFDRVIITSVTITGSPTDIFIGDSPVMTPYGENVSFTIIYYDVGNATGVVNATGLYPGNVHIYIDVLTPGQALTQNLMTIAEIDPIGNPGEYRIEFNTTYLSGIIGCQLRVWFNWTKSAMPLYENQTILLTVYSTYRQTVTDWTPLPITPYDELVNLTLIYRDVLSGDPILNSGSLSINVPTYGFSVYYLGDATGEFVVEVDTSLFGSIAIHSFQVQITWDGSPYYQNRTINVLINVRERYTDLTHGSYTPIQFAETLIINFTYRDLDDYTSAGMNGGNLTLVGLVGYSFYDNGDGTYTVYLDTSVFDSLGTFTVNVEIEYGGTRFCADAADFFYLTVIQRRTQLTSELPELAPYLTQANITVRYIDDTTGSGIVEANVYAYCATSSQSLVLNSNYWIDDAGEGYYLIRISTVALGTFGTYTIQITVNWTGSPYYQQRIRTAVVEVSRRPASLTVSKSPLNTPFLSSVHFEITITDILDGSPISIDKSVLILTHSFGTVILDSEYTLSGANGIYVIGINSTTLTSVLVSDYPINIKFFWGDTTPYYANSTTSTQVTITNRYTQVSVLSTPSGYYYFNLSATLRFSDYLTAAGIPGATVTVSCLNDTSFQRWVTDNGDGTYTLLIDTNDLDGIGRYFFSANFTWTGSPYYSNVFGVDFSVNINPVSTSLSFDLPQGVTYYLGDTVVGNITFRDISEGFGIDDANVTTDWESLYGTTASVSKLGDGVYQLSIDTSGLNAQIYVFAINASKYLHLNRSITADISLAVIPVQIQLIFIPTNPTWGEDVEMSANVTDARNGNPVIGAHVNLSVSTFVYDMEDVGGGIYNLTLPTYNLISGEFTIRIQSTLTNYESRQRDFQIRIDKVASKLTASLDPDVAVNGQVVAVTAHYLILSNGTPIEIGIVTYTWTGGSGVLIWSASEMAYIGQIVVDNTNVGNHQILIQASSTIHKSVSTPITIEISEIATEIQPYQDITVLSVVSGDSANVTVYLANTDLGGPVLNAVVEYGGPFGVNGSLVELGKGYYTANVPTSEMEIGTWYITVSSDKDGFTPATFRFSLIVEKVPTEVAVVGNAILGGYYGENVTFAVQLKDTHNNLNISGAFATFTLEGISGLLIDNGNGFYSFTVNTTWVTAGQVAHNIYLSFQLDRYDSAFSVVQLRSLPIPTSVSGVSEFTIPYGDDFSQIFTYVDTLHDEFIDDATAFAIWEFGTQALTSLNNGSYRFGFLEAERTSLAIRENPYVIRIQFSRSNFSSEKFEFLLTVRPIATEVLFEVPETTYVGEVFYVRLTFMDTDHNLPLPGALNITSGLDSVSPLTVDYGNGTYVFAFEPPRVQLYRLTITLQLSNHETGVFERDIYSVLTPEAQALINSFSYLGLFLILIAILAASYIRVWSVPKLLRILRRMVSRLANGVIPPPANVRGRRSMILDEMNSDLEPVGIKKTLQDIAPSTVEVIELDVEKLLNELATMVGLAESDIRVLRGDLDKMRPSERAGFIAEVIRQERARRAREIAEAEAAAEERPAEEAERRLTEDELQHLREELIRMGIEPSEADLMVEQARSLTKAEIDALLDQIGGLK